MATGRHISNWRDLKEFGIDALTGEACGLGMRILCDVTEKGAEHIARFLGGNVEVRRGSNWNGGDRDNPSIGSVMLPYSVFGDLAAFLLLTTGDLAVVTTADGDTFEYDPAKLELDPESVRDDGTGLPRWIEVKRTWRRSTAPGTGDRNRHAFTWRVE